MTRLAWILLVTAAGCGSTEALAPVPTESEPATPVPTTTATTPDDPATPLPPVKRTVMTRNPLGGPVGNHFVDGDFEMSFVPPGGIPQLGWLAFAGGGAQVALKAETGGLCRTGLRCGVFEKGTVMLGRGATADHGAGNLVSLWAKVPEGETCDVVSAILVDCDTFFTSKKLKEQTDEPGADGWCEYAGSTPERDSGQCLYLDNSLASGQVALVDSAVLAPDDGTVAPRAAEAWTPSSEQWEQMLRVRKRIRDHLGYAPPPEPPLPL